MPHSIECQRHRYLNPYRLCDCNTDEWPIEPLPVDSETLEKFTRENRHPETTPRSLNQSEGNHRKFQVLQERTKVGGVDHKYASPLRSFPDESGDGNLQT